MSKPAGSGDSQKQGDDLSVAADKATILGLNISRKALLWTVIGVAVAVIAVVVTVVTSSGGGGGQNANVSGTGNNVNQNSGTQNQASGTCGQIGNGNSCVVQLQDLSKDTPTDGEFKAKLEKLSTAAPASPGPWAFVIIDTGNLGLFARSANIAQANRVGYAMNRDLVWADCVASSDFTPPDPGNDVGPQWLKVRWKNDQPSSNHMLSDPGDTKQAWMYRGLTVPFGHNGDIPSC